MYIFPGSRLLSQLMNAMLAVKTKTTIVAIFFHYDKHFTVFKFNSC